MNSSNDRVLLHVSAAAAFLISVVTLVLASSKVALNPSLSVNVIRGAMTVLNVSILLSSLASGGIGAIVLAVLASFVAIIADLRVGYHLWYFVGTFIVTAAVGRLCRRRIEEDEQSRSLRAEKREEEINILVDTVRKTQREIDALRKKIERYAALKEVAESLSTTLSLDEIASLVVDSATRIVGKADRALFFLVDRDKQGLALYVSRSGVRAAKIKDKKGDVVDIWVLKQRKPLLIEDTTRDFRFPQSNLSEARKYYRSLISAPLVMESKVMGVLRLDSAKELAFNQDDLRLLDVIAALAAVALENNSLYKKTEELAIKDGLTNLVVQRYFKERLNEETKRASLSKSSFSLLMLDIDYFKDYNDRYGHIAGDIVLRYLAGILKDTAGEGDLVARYGGEEFAVIMLGKNKREAMDKAETIRGKIESEPLILRREKANLTVSIGVASFPADTLIAEEMIKKADDRLYKAKKEGRNRISG